MNDLSWFLYLADAYGNLRGVSLVIALLGGGGISLWAFIAGQIACMDKEPYAGPKWLFVIPAIATMFLILTPSRETVYAIAASEMGEEVLKSSTATKAQKALDAWLDKQIKENSR